MHEKAKRFGPSPLGLTMLRHVPSKNSLAYNLLGKSPETEISFSMPGIRIESILVGRHRLLLVRDADTEARWNYQLKNEFAQSQGEGREFKNPVRSTTLRWRSWQPGRVIALMARLWGVPLALRARCLVCGLAAWSEPSLCTP